MRRPTLPEAVAVVFAGILAASMIYGGVTGSYDAADRAMAPGILGVTFLLGLSAARSTKETGGSLERGE